jgi:uroporphyrinogen-III synthase
VTRPERPLAGRTILLPRPRESGAGLARRLRRLGARVERRPTIALEALADAAPARRALERVDDYDWLLFTSRPAVRFFFTLLSDVAGARRRPAARTAAVGRGTAEELAARGLPPSVTATRSRAEGLAEALRGRIGPGDRVLWPRAEAARDLLADAVRASGATLEVVAVYRNVAARGLGELVERLRGGRYDAVVFTSPSTFERLLEHEPGEPLRRALGGLALVAIGGVTAEALARAGLPARAVAAQPTDAGLADAVCRALR